MGSADLKIVDGKAAGAWIEPELSAEVGTVTSVVPDRFEAYARILHPARDADGRSMAWAEVAAETGRAVHPLVQWESLVATDSYQGEGTIWRGDPPEIGGLDEQPFTVLCDLLDRHTQGTLSCFFGIWGSFFNESFAGSKVAEAQRLHLPGRDYTILAGPLSAARQIVGSASIDSLNLIWPADRAWFVGTEIDFDSTLVGGTKSLIDDLLGSPELETFRVEPTDSLTYDADHINPPAPWRETESSSGG
jgi:hypothetical protein